MFCTKDCLTLYTLSIITLINLYIYTAQILLSVDFRIITLDMFLMSANSQTKCSYENFPMITYCFKTKLTSFFQLSHRELEEKKFLQ